MKKAYLISYNVLSALLWGAVLVEGVLHLLRNAPAVEFWNSVAHRIMFVQHLALLEIVHSAIGLVGSPLIPTIIQVASRVFVLDVFTYPAPECHDHFSLYLMLLSWSCVEVPRYSFYAFQVSGDDKSVPYFLFFLRYSLFMVLYPTGITGEILQEIVSYPFWERNKMDFMVRFSHVVIGLLYVPLGPFMVWNMWMMRKRAMQKRFRAPEVMAGISWPVTNSESGERSTTDTGKKILASAAKGANSEGGSTLATRTEKARSWRFGYAKYFEEHVKLCCASDAATVASVAQAGLDAAHETFTFVEGKREISFREAMGRPSGAKKFFTASRKGKLSPTKHSLVIKYNDKELSGDALTQQCDEWAKRDRIERSAAEAIKAVAANAEKWMDLSDVLFIMLGANSAMGPLDNLLAHGTTVVAIDIKTVPTWQKLFSRVDNSRGTIIYPLDAANVAEEEHVKHAGCDMLKDTLALCEWLDEVIDQHKGKKLVVGNYTYLDGEKHVRLALAGDAIMSRICKKRRDAILAFLCTPTDDHVIPAEAREAAKANFAKATWWQRILVSLGVLERNDKIPRVNDHYIVDGIVKRQGPNYALAKRIQHWRALVARANGHTVSSNVAPSTATLSVLSNPQFAAGYYGWRYFRPLEVFLQETSGGVMFALMINDIRNALSKANPTVGLPHPLNLFTEQSFHGGIWRCGFTVDSTGVPAAVSYYLQTYAPVIVGAIAILGGCARYIAVGF